MIFNIKRLFASNVRMRSKMKTHSVILNRFYPVWLWLLTIIVTPIIFFTIMATITAPTDNGSEIALIGPYIMFGALFSSPASLITFLLYQHLRSASLSNWLLKLTTISIATIGMIVTLNLIDSVAFSTLKLAYGTTIITSGVLKTKTSNRHN